MAEDERGPKPVAVPYAPGLLPLPKRVPPPALGRGARDKEHRQW